MIGKRSIFIGIVVFASLAASIVFLWENYRYYNPTFSRFGRDTAAVFEDGRYQIVRCNTKYALFFFDNGKGKNLLEFLNFEIDSSGSQVFLVGKDEKGAERFVYHVFRPLSGKIDTFIQRTLVPSVFKGEFERLESEVLKATREIPRPTRAYPLD